MDSLHIVAEVVRWRAEAEKHIIKWSVYQFKIDFYPDKLIILDTEFLIPVLKFLHCSRKVEIE